MRNTNSGLHHARTWTLGGLLLLLAVAAQAAPPIVLTAGLTGGVGISHDQVKNHLYYVDFNGGTLKRIKLNPACETAPPCPIDTVVTGFSHPEDVAVDGALSVGYVTTRDDLGTTGALWRVDLATGVRSLVTFNLGAPHQIVLDTPTNTAYVVGFDVGKLWKIDLTTGVKVAVVTGLGHPVGLAITADRARAYVSEQNFNRVSEYDMALGTRIRDVAVGLVSPFYLSWTDPAQISLYVAERGPLNQITRIDLATATKLPVLTALPLNPSGIALNYTGSALYLTTDKQVLRAELASLPMSEPVFLGVGHVPSTKIVAGYATTDPGYFFQVKHAPFGGTLNIFGNLSNFKMLGATHYRVLVSNGGPYTALGQSWTAYRWNTTTLQYEAVNVAPVTADQRYAIPPEYPALAARWYPAFLMMRWPSSANGSYNFKVEIYNGAANPVQIPLPTGNSLTLEIDNTPPTVDLVAIRQHNGVLVKPCDIVTAAPNLFDFQITATDPNQHMLSYSLAAYWGKNKSEAISGAADSYSPGHVAPAPPHAWGGVINAWLPAAGWPAKCNCAHTFFLRAWKRTTDGYSYVLSGESHQSITINNTGVVCP